MHLTNYKPLFLFNLQESFFLKKFEFCILFEHSDTVLLWVENSSGNFVLEIVGQLGVNHV